MDRTEIQLSKQDLEPLVTQGVSVAEIADRLGSSSSSVRRAIAVHGAGKRSITRDCRKHGTTEFAIVGSALRLHCKKCRAEAVAKRRRRVKELLVEEAGGGCLICGYSRSIVALEFHHLDPGQKAFGVAQRGITRAIEEVRREVKKCVLLCANCHAEVEWGVTKLPEAVVSEQAFLDYTIA